MQHSKAHGSRAETEVSILFDKVGIKNEIVQGKCSTHDIEATLGKKMFTVEVKFDMMAATTGNVAIEIWNSKSDKPSGLTVTEANIWAHCIKDGTNIVVYVANVIRLRKFIEDNKAKRMLSAAGDKNATILLYDIDHILGAVFTRIDNIDEKLIKKTIKELI